MNTNAATTAHRNICQHGAYADLCITCHPEDCPTVKAAIAETTRLNVAKVDRDARSAASNRLYAAEHGIDCAECGHGDVRAMADAGCECCQAAAR